MEELQARESDLDPRRLRSGVTTAKPTVLKALLGAVGITAFCAGAVYLIVQSNVVGVENGRNLRKHEADHGKGA